MIPVTCAPLGRAEFWIKLCLSIQLFEFAQQVRRVFPWHVPCRVQSHNLFLRHDILLNSEDAVTFRRDKRTAKRDIQLLQTLKRGLHFIENGTWRLTDLPSLLSRIG